MQSLSSPSPASPLPAAGGSGAVPPLSMLTIDVDAVVANWRLLRDRAGGAECAAVMKADAYGLGARILGPALAEAGCRSFFVAHAAEGVALRAWLDAAGHAAPRIFILHGAQAGEAPLFAASRLIPVLSTGGQVRHWQEAARAAGRALPAALHVDSGMNRLGLPPAEFRRLAGETGGLDGLALELVLTHLACADEPEDPMNRQQLALFSELRRLLPEVPASAANSAGVFHGIDYAFDLVRPGIALYGVDPIARDPARNPLQRVVDLHGRILQIREIDASEAVGYGAAFRAARRSRIATVSVGYADGYLRSLSCRAHGAIGGIRVPLAGRVSMDLLTFDITDIPDGAVREGDYLELAGPTIGLGELAAAGGTIGYELLTRLGSRFSRRYKKAGQVIEPEASSVMPQSQADGPR